MHYYQFNIGNYRRKAHYLSILEHGIYRLLLDTYYLEEKPLCADNAKLMRTHSVRSAEEVKAFESVINDFFVLTDEGYRHLSCDREIKKFTDKSSKAAASAKARWDKKAKAMRTHSEGNANHKPITNNQLKEKNIKKEKAPRKIFKPPTVEEVTDYCKTRKNEVDPEKWSDFYQSKNWMIGKNKMKDWKAAVRTWEKNSNETNQRNSGSYKDRHYIDHTDTSWDIAES